MKRSKPQTLFRSSEDYLWHFFIQVLLLTLDMPDEMIDELEQALKLAKERKQEMKERLERLKEQKHD